MRIVGTTQNNFDCWIMSIFSAVKVSRKLCGKAFAHRSLSFDFRSDGQYFGTCSS